jgi:aminoglycoside phosphotransferase (APT) family kinase protein
MAMERLHAVGEVDWEAVGAMVRRLHTIDPAEVGVDARCGDFPHWQVEELLASARPGLDPASLAGIERCMGQWQGWRDRMDSAPAVLCHGDLHPGNVMQTERGPALLDWDMRCRGPVAWDHGPLLQWEDRWTTRWGGGLGTYDAFAAGYGANLRDNWLARALAAMRMVIATLMRVRAALTDPSAVPEAQRRLAYWRGDADAPLWEPQ